MKITDIFETFQTNNDSTFLKNKDSEKVGYGAFSDVFLSKEPEQTVIKQVRTTIDMGFDYWVKSLVKDRLRQKNPTFPRFFNIKTENGVVIDAEMEKLFPIIDLSQEHTEQLYQYVFEKDIIDVYKIRYYLVDSIDEEIRYGISKIKNSNIKSACKIIQKLYQARESKNDLVLDLGLQNMMARIYKYGVQLVITDPFA